MASWVRRVARTTPNGERGPLDPSEAIAAGRGNDLLADDEAQKRLDDRDDRKDEDLVEQVLDGNQRAFEALLRRHEVRVLRVLRLLGVPPEDRECASPYRSPVG